MDFSKRSVNPKISTTIRIPAQSTPRYPISYGRNAAAPTAKGTQTQIMIRFIARSLIFPPILPRAPLALDSSINCWGAFPPNRKGCPTERDFLDQLIVQVVCVTLQLFYCTNAFIPCGASGFHFFNKIIYLFCAVFQWDGVGLSPVFFVLATRW